MGKETKTVNDKQNIAIKVDNISKVYRLYKTNADRVKEAFSFFKKKKFHKDYYALNNISFELERGGSLGVIGRNGAGKSTLLKIITSVITPTSGHFKVNGKISALIELGAGFNPEFSGVENIYFNGSILGYSKEDMDKKYDEIVSFADIGDYIYQPVKTYSSGMFVRLAFSVATSVNPDILIIDEALSVGDMFFQAKCADRMKSLLAGENTLIFVSHNVNAVKTLCEKSILLDKGRIIHYGKSEDVVEKYFQMKIESERTSASSPVKKKVEKLSNKQKDISNHKPLKKFSIDRVGKKMFRDKKTILISKNDGEEISITGWAIDFDNKDIGEELYLCIDDEMYKADYGLERDDVAQVYGHSNYVNSGFRVYVPVKAFDKDYENISLVLKRKGTEQMLTGKVDRRIKIQERLSKEQLVSLSGVDNRAFQKRASYNRIQNGKADFLNIQLLNKKGKEIISIEYDQNVTLRMVLKVNEDIEKLAFAYHIQNKNGISIIYSDSSISDSIMRDLKKGEKYRIDIDLNLKLAHGSYNILTAISIPIDISIGKVDFCDYVPLAYQFNVQNRKGSPLYGFTNIDNKVNISKL